MVLCYVLDMFDSEFRNHLFNFALELNFILEDNPKLISIYENEVKLVIDTIDYLCLYTESGNDLNDVFELEDEYGTNPGVDLIYDAYHNLSNIRKNLD